jgi:hypothetical protein
METSSLEARNIWFVNSNLSRVQESKLIPAKTLLPFFIEMLQYDWL